MIQYLYESCGIPVRNMYYTCTGWRKLVNFEAISGDSGVSPDQRAFCDTKCVSGKTRKSGEMIRILFEEKGEKWYNKRKMKMEVI